LYSSGDNTRSESLRHKAVTKCASHFTNSNTSIRIHQFGHYGSARWLILYDKYDQALHEMMLAYPDNTTFLLLGFHRFWLSLVHSVAKKVMLNRTRAILLSNSEPLYNLYIICEQKFRQLIDDYQVTLRMPLFQCVTYFNIPWAYVCDGRNNCPDKSDEKDCSNQSAHIVKELLHSQKYQLDCYNHHPSKRCECIEGYFHCYNGGCISLNNLCDAIEDCSDGSDEYQCPPSSGVSALGKGRYSTHLIRSTSSLCLISTEWIQCSVLNQQCYIRHRICQYDHDDNGNLAHCTDGAYLQHFCKDISCSFGFKCVEAYCIPLRKVCDGKYDCPGRDDELFCEHFTCPSLLRCFHTNICVPPWEICDDVRDCPLLGEDEAYCKFQCPFFCECHGHAVICHQGQGLDDLVAKADKVKALTVRGLTTFNSSNSILNKFVSLLFLTLSNCSLTSVPHTIEKGVHSLKLTMYIDLSFNLLPYLSKMSFDLKYLLQLNLKHNIITSIHEETFHEHCALEVLILSHNLISSVNKHYFHSLKNLKVLLLEDNPIAVIHPHALVHLHYLQVLKTDMYYICCLAEQAEQCYPPTDSISSCHKLLQSVTMRVFIYFQLMTTLCNVAILVIPSKYRPANDYLERHLAVADLHMSLYLGIITGTDLIYSNTFWTVISTFQQSIICHIAGAINMLSYELSLIFKILISGLHAKYLTSIEPFSISKRVKLIAFIMWTSAFIISFSTVLMSHYKVAHIKMHHNLCLYVTMYGIVPQSPLEIVFQALYIAANTILIILICFFYLYVPYISYKSQRMSDLGKMQAKNKTSIAKLLLTTLLLVMPGLCSWFPLMVTLIITYVVKGVIEQTVFLYIIIIYVPITASLNPMLYFLRIWKLKNKNK
jgi:hypothetical protein